MVLSGTAGHDLQASCNRRNAFNGPSSSSLRQRVQSSTARLTWRSRYVPGLVNVAREIGMWAGVGLGVRLPSLARDALALVLRVTQSATVHRQSHVISSPPPLARPLHTTSTKPLYARILSRISNFIPRFSTTHVLSHGLQTQAFDRRLVPLHRQLPRLLHIRHTADPSIGRECRVSDKYTIKCLGLYERKSSQE